MACEHCMEWKPAGLLLCGEAPTYVPPVYSPQPSICPLCHGSGTKTVGLSGTCNGLMDVVCNGCKGRGIVWQP